MSLAEVRRWLGVIGAGLSSVFVLYHLWEHWPIRHGAFGVLSRLRLRFSDLPVWLETLLVVVPFCALAYVVARAWFERPPAPDNCARSRASSRSWRNRRVAGTVLVLFVLWHLVSIWWGARVMGRGEIYALDAGESQLHQLWGAGLYVVGWSALSTYAGYGLRDLLIVRFQGNSEKCLNLLAFLGSVLLWLLGLDLVSAYVAGAPFL